jgi:hypothetical protein
MLLLSQEGLAVEFSKVEAVEASCNGTLCDRQNPILHTSSCGCLYYNRMCSIVLEMAVTFKTIDSNGYKNQYSVPHFQSWRTSQVFIHPMAMTADNAVFWNIPEKSTMLLLISKTLLIKMRGMDNCWLVSKR